MTGIQLTEAMRRMGSRIPVLLVSGHGGALLAERAASAGVRSRVGKAAPALATWHGR